MQEQSRRARLLAQWPQASRWIIVGGIFLVALSAGLAGLAIVIARQASIEDALAEQAEVAAVLSEQTSRYMKVVDLLLRHACERAEVPTVTVDSFARDLGDEATHRMLADTLRGLPEANAITLVGAQGKLVNFSRIWPIPPIDVTDRDYFRHFADNGGQGLFLSTPHKSRFNGRPTVFAARRLNGRNGEFLGVAAVAIDMNYIADSYRAVNVQAGESISLFRLDGALLARYPPVPRRDDALGIRLPHAALGTTPGHHRIPDPVTGAASLIAAAPVHGYPLVIEVGATESDALAKWRGEARLIVLAALGAAVIFGALTSVIAIQFRRQEEQNRNLRQAAEELLNSEQRVRSFAEMASDWFWEQDAELRFVSIHSRLLLFHDGESAVFGKTRWDMATGDPTVEPWVSHIRDLMERRPFRDFRYQFTDDQGRLHHVMVNGDPVFTADGTFLGYRGTGRDMTREVEAEEELRAAQQQAEAGSRTKSEILATMSHELRTPLNAILGFSQLIGECSVGSHAEYAAEIHESGRYLLDLVNNVLELSRLEAGRHDLRDAVIELGDVVQRSLGMLRLRAREASVALEWMPASAQLRADPRAIQQIVLNLLTNAVKFTPAGGRVDIRLHQDTNGALALTIADTGIGIAPDALLSVGEPFRQANNSIARKFGGTGLGLAICHKLIELHDGSLTLTSTPDIGTTATVTFPASRVISFHPAKDEDASLRTSVAPSA